MRAWIGWLIALLLLAGCSDEHDQLMRELKHRSPVIRAGAVKSLARLGDDAAYTLVSRSLEDRSAIVRISAVKALREFKDRNTSAGLVRASLDRDPEVREAAVVELGARKDSAAQEALVRLLLRGEPVLQVRKAAHAALDAMGLSGERLTDVIANSQLALAREVLDKGAPAERIQAVRQAGRSVLPAGVDLVLGALAVADPDVVQAGLGVLDGRGGPAALRRLQLLLSDPLDAVRVVTVRALGAFGADGLKLLEPALRDSEAQVRLAALELFERRGVAIDPQSICPLLTDEDPRVALRAAGLLRGREAGCDLAPLRDGLGAEDAVRRQQALGVLSALGGAAAIGLLDERLQRADAGAKPAILAALARAGAKRPEIGPALRREFGAAIDEIGRLETRWVTGKIPATGPSADVDQPAEDKSRLSDEELRKLYEKHGLGPVDENAPRSVGDILAGFADAESAESSGSLSQAVSPELVDKVSMTLDGLLQVQPDLAGEAVGLALAARSPILIARVAQILLAHNVTVQLSQELLDNLQAALEIADEREAASLLEWLTQSRDPRLVPVLIDSLQTANLDKRLALIEALGRLGQAEAVPALSAQLKGYSAIPAARALARIGDRSAVEALRKAIGNAGPAEELEIDLALAQLGDRELVPQMIERLDDSNPEVRRAAVQALGRLGGKEELDAIGGLRYDLDRRVRAEVKRVLKAGKTGDEADGGPKTGTQGRSGQPAEKGKVRQGPGTVPAGGPGGP